MLRRAGIPLLRLYTQLVKRIDSNGAVFCPPEVAILTAVYRVLSHQVLVFSCSHQHMGVTVQAASLPSLAMLLQRFLEPCEGGDAARL